jgi:16S rRNA (uracil1498-N3)-methyltransferase
VTELRTVDREPRRKLTLAVSLPKGDRQKVLVEKLTELGVQRLVPLRTQRSVAQPSDGALERLEQHVMAACKQSGRTRKMEIALPLDLAQLAAWNQPAVRLIAHPGQGRETVLEQIGSDEIAVAIGPEGGFTDEEVAALVASGWQTLQLGPRLLRIETAAIAVAAKWLL